MNIQFDNQQPGDPEQLARAVQEAEYHYESSRAPVIVYWDQVMSRYRITYQSLYEPKGTMEVVRIPK